MLNRFARTLALCLTAAAPAAAQSTDIPPRATLAAYLSLLDAGDLDDMSLYTVGTVAFFNTWPRSVTQMANEARSIRDCGYGEVVMEVDRAVILGPRGMADCNPYFLALEGGAWKLDFVTMSEVLRFDEDGRWGFRPPNRPDTTAYGFAFAGRRFDARGYPID